MASTWVLPAPRSILGQAGWQCQMLLVHQVVGLAEGWIRRQKSYIGTHGVDGKGQSGILCCGVMEWGLSQGSASNPYGRELASCGANYTQEPGPPSCSMQRGWLGCLGRCKALELLQGTDPVEGSNSASVVMGM